MDLRCVEVPSLTFNSRPRCACMHICTLLQDETSRPSCEGSVRGVHGLMDHHCALCWILRSCSGLQRTPVVERATDWRCERRWWASIGNDCSSLTNVHSSLVLSTRGRLHV